MNVEEREIKQFSEFDEITPESTQNLITDKGRFTVGTLYNAVLEYIRNLVSDITNQATEESTAVAESHANTSMLYAEESHTYLEETKASAKLAQTLVINATELGQRKSNRGEFWFNKGTLTCANKWTTDSAFSLAFTFAMTQADWTSMSAMSSAHWIHTAIYGNKTGVNLSDSGGNLLLILTCEGITGVSTYKNAIRISDWANYLDGKSHCVVASFGNGSLAINIDGIEKGRLAIADFVPDVSQLPLSIRHYGQMSRIKYFNFDMSDANAPYTIADYIAGKDESPLLNLGNDFNFNLTQESTFTQRIPESNLTLTDSSTNVGYIKFEADSTSSAPYFWFPLGKVIKKGAKVRVSFDYKTYTGYGYLSVGFGTQGKFATTDSISSGTKTITLSNDCDCIVFVGYQSTTIQCDIRMSAFANGALLSLEDIKSGVQVLDKSGNGNHANISGTVYASKENNPARCVDSASFSWAGTATTQKFANSDVAIPTNSKVVAYAKASVGMSASFTCGSNSAVSKELSANTLTEIGSFFNASQGAFNVAPSSAITGKMDVYLTIEKF